MGNLGNSGILVWSPHLRDPNLPWTEPEQIIQCSYNSLPNILYDMLLKKVQNFQSTKKKNNTNHQILPPNNNHPVQQKHIKITANPNVPTLLVWLRCGPRLNRIVNWQNKNGKWLFWIFRFPPETILSGGMVEIWVWQWAIPADFILFSNSAIRKVWQKQISHHTQSMAIYQFYELWEDASASVFIFTLLDDAVTEIFPVICFPLTSSWHRTVTTASHSRTDNPAR